MNEPQKLFTKIDKLIDVWCERRCLKPLSYLLQNYPFCEELRGQWEMLLQSLEEIDSLHGHELTLDERKLLSELIHSVERNPWSFYEIS
ncbi:MAG: hypothetical protein ACH346_06160 [Chthoniobacterales bacterium]